MSQASSSPHNFEETRWSLILKTREEVTVVSKNALAELCGIYWLPVYTYIRRKGCAAEEAQDLTQEFFLRLLEKRYVEDVFQGRGRFRSFLMGCINHFLSDEWRKNKAQKRGGGQVHLSLDFAGAEALYADSLSEDLTPDKLFDHQWAQTVLAHALGRVRREYENNGKGDVFDTLKVVVTAPEYKSNFAELGRELGISEGAARTAAYRLRKRYKVVLMHEVSQTLDKSESADDELNYLLEALR